MTSAPLVPTEPLEHNDKAPAGAAEGPPLTDDNEVRLTLAGTYRPALPWKAALGSCPRLRRGDQAAERALGWESGDSDSVTLYDFDRVTCPSELVYKIGGTDGLCNI